VSKALVDGRSRGLTFDLRGLTPFATGVLEGARTIPPGEIRPYAWLAREVGRPRAVRAVGTALGHNPVPILIPCHRIVRSDGHIGDYAWGSAVKRRALAAEGLDPDAFERLAAHGERYIGSDTTHIVCLPTCRYAKRVMTRHRVPFASLDDAAAAGYRGCKVCRPA
jgi:O-6-methylguanine DNA methyltransferase